MPSERDPDLPGGSDDPTRANDPVDPTRSYEPVDATHVQGAAPAAGIGRPADSGAPFADEQRRRDPDDGDRKGAAWLWALLAAVLIGIVLYALLQEGDDDDDAVGTDDQAETGVVPEDTVAPDTAPEDTTAETAAPEDTATDEGAASDDTAVTTAPAAGGDAPTSEDDPGTIAAADGTDLFTLIEGDAGDAERLAPYAGQDMTGEDVVVLEVVDGQGFWVGADDQQRIFARTTDALSVQAGDRIGFDGSLEANGSDDAIELSDDQGAELHDQQGHHIDVGSVTAT